MEFSGMVLNYYITKIIIIKHLLQKRFIHNKKKALSKITDLENYDLITGLWTSLL